MSPAATLCPIASAPLDQAALLRWLALTLHPRISPAHAVRTVAQWQGAPPISALHDIAHEPAPAAQGSREASNQASLPLQGQDAELETVQPPAEHHSGRDRTPLDRALERAVKWSELPQHSLLAYSDPRYPDRLRHLHDPPLLIYVCGQPEALSQASVAIVGSRGATHAGCELAASWAHALAMQGWCVVSGLARGIDGAAHRGALASIHEGGSTVAVMATGADRIYPPRHRALARQMMTRGALLTELPLGTPSQRFQFPRRNRLVAALARGVVVVEAAAQSGSLITARLAAELGREVFAVPGSVYSPLSRGCHALLREGATLAESVEDIVRELDGSLGLRGGPAPRAASLAVEASPLEQKVLKALGYDAVTLDTLLQRSKLEPGTLQALLLDWELAGRVVRTPDGRFQRRGGVG